MTFDEIAWPVIEGIAANFREIPKRKATEAETRDVIVRMCSWGYLTIADLSALLGRSPLPLRRNYLTPMVKEGILELAFPHTPSHPKQGYRLKFEPPSGVTPP